MSLAESLLVEFGPEIQSLTLVPSGGGVFDVRVDDDVVFSKYKLGHFPKEDDVKAIRAHIRERLKS